MVEVVMTVAEKASSLIRGGYSLEQVALRLKRSPLRRAIKTFRTLGCWGEKQERRRIARALQTPEAGQMAQRLRQEGGAMLTGLDSALTEELILAARQHVGQGVARSGGRKDFWSSLLSKAEIDDRSPFVRFALQPRIVQAASAYVGELPLIVSIHLLRSLPQPAPYKVSQLWHLDYEDARMVKLFVYLTDVSSDDDGPFNYVPPGPSRRVSFHGSAHLPDETVFRRVDRQEVRQVLGSRGQAFMVDTSRCIHMGSRLVPGHERLLYTVCFIAVPSLYESQAVRASASTLRDRQTELLLTP
ncbi:MAG: hypothetical protein ACREDZ_15870 [Kiloniellales bacterium]